jgi:dimethylargininase
MFKKALVRTPGKSLVAGITSAKLGLPDYHKALDQHQAYIHALEVCGLDVDVLPPLEEYPDSCFIEDVAVLTPTCAIITRPGALSRIGEIDGLDKILGEYYDSIKKIQPPGTLEGGDVLMVGSHFFIGCSERTSWEGALQLIEILKENDFTGSIVSLEEFLHLKTGIAYLENNNLVASGELLNLEVFNAHNILPVPEDESYAANCIWINGTVLVPIGHPQTAGIIRSAGYSILEVDLSEFQKLDGGLSCLSLRF